MGRSRYDKEFKLMAIELLNTGKTATEVGKELGISHDSASRWKREYESEGALAFPGNGKQNLSKEEEEIARLKKELKEAQLERDILKKAVGIFSKSDRKFFDS